jgi:fructose/tagatose bisphosphate aldolase
MLFSKVDEILSSVDGILSVTENEVKVLDEGGLKDQLIERLVYNAALCDNQDVKDLSCWLIRGAAEELGIVCASIQGLYEARGRDEYKDMSVPAVNLRGLTFDLSRALFRCGLKNNSQSFIFEIAKSEIAYTMQSPSEYSAVILAAAIKEGYRGPVFIQADHVQVKSKNFHSDKTKEIESLKKVIKKELDAGFYNIDIDSSTLVDLDKATIDEQQKFNYEVAAELTDYIRKHQPVGIEVSVGGEIGEVGSKNSTPEELKTFMEGYNKSLNEINADAKGISKISVQTGTSHGGVVLADGSVAKVKVDFETLETLSRIAREDYGLGGAVQHGASTLPQEAFNKFAKTQTLEVHLATGFQNTVYESKNLPDGLRKDIYDYLKSELASERKEGQTDEQFIYALRKKGFGPFKKEFMDLPQDVRDAISAEVEAEFDFIFKQMNAVNTKELVSNNVALVKSNPTSPVSI